MQKETIKEGFKEAEKEMKKKQIEDVKKIVLASLEKISEKEKLRDSLNEELGILKQDVRDLKEGRLDRIEERQKKNPQAKKCSVVIVEKEVVKEVPVIKEIHHMYEHNWWYEPYRIVWQPPTVYCGGDSSNFTLTTGLGNTGMCLGTSAIIGNLTSIINCSVAKDATIGTYELSSGIVKSI